MTKYFHYLSISFFILYLTSCGSEKENPPLDPIFERQIFAVDEVLFHRYLFEITLSFYQALEKNGFMPEEFIFEGQVDCESTTYQWTPATQSILINYGQSCNPAVSFIRSGSITVSLPGDRWSENGDMAILEFEGLRMAQRTLSGSINIRRGSGSFQTTFNQNLTYDISLIHEDELTSQYSGEWNATVTTTSGAFNTYSYTGNNGGSYKDKADFTSQIVNNFQLTLLCRGLDNSGFTRGSFDSFLGNDYIETFFASEEACSQAISVSTGGVFRRIPI